MHFTRLPSNIKQENDEWPQRVIIYRDGVGDSRLDLVLQWEVPQVLEACKGFGIRPQLSVVIVSKRINTRFYRLEGRGQRGRGESGRGETGGTPENPVPGTVLDRTVTKKGMRDFFLVSQQVNDI